MTLDDELNLSYSLLFIMQLSSVVHQLRNVVRELSLLIVSLTLLYFDLTILAAVFAALGGRSRMLCCWLDLQDRGTN